AGREEEQGRGRNDGLRRGLHSGFGTRHAARGRVWVGCRSARDAARGATVDSRRDRVSAVAARGQEMSPTGQEPAAAASWLVRLATLWAEQPLALKVGVIASCAALVVYGIVRLLIRMGRSGRRHLLVGSTIVFLLAAVGFST